MTSVNTSVEKLLVVNADDFGLHPDINRAIEQAHREGIVTSTSLVACGAAFEQAVEIAHRCPSLDIGVHLTLVEEKPLCPPSNIPSLVRPDGTFWLNYRTLTPRLLRGQIKLAEVRQELACQVERILATGLRPSHLDSHQHVHLLPGLWAITVELAHHYRIPWVRVPTFSSLTDHTFSRPEPLFRLGLNLLSRLRAGQAKRKTLHYAGHSPGLYLSGRLTTTALLPLLPHLPPGLSELVTHPGFTTLALQQLYHWDYHWTQEFEALTAPQIRQTLTANNIRLVRFSDLTSYSR
jgi:hopanoid biosynthesis associated protein HpnK